jgi:endonuclease-3
MVKSDRYKAFLQYFSESSPNPETELHYSSPYELLVAVILSAQCTDKRINQVTPALFRKYPHAEALSTADPADVFDLIRSVSYPNNKAKHLVGMGKMLWEDFKNDVPSSIEDLQKLPGVGRKTANVIASVIYELPAMAVDTHVFRVSHRLGLTRAKTVLGTEKDLVKFIPEEKIRFAHHWLILHGRYTCLARKPLCDSCALTSFCQYYQKKNKIKVEIEDLVQ